MSLLDTASLIVTPNGYKEGKLYSVIPSDGSGDLSVTRATTATRVNSQGLVELVPYNLLGYSEDFTNASWLKGASTITGNTTTAPNGTTTADTFTGNGASDLHIVLWQTDLIGVGNTISVYAKKNTNNFLQIYTDFVNTDFANFDLNNGVVGSVGSTVVSSSIENVGNGWYRCSFVVGSSASKFVNFCLVTSASASRAQTNTLSTSVFLWGAQLNEGTLKDYQKTETRLNIPRLDYSNGTCPSILVEPQRTNRALYSSSFDNGSWDKAFVSVTANQIASPSGVQDADKLVENSANEIHALYNLQPYSSTTTATASVFFKKGTRKFFSIKLQIGGNSYTQVYDSENVTTTSNSSNGLTNVSSSIIDFGNGWVRAILTGTNPSGAADAYTIYGLSNSGTPTFNPSNFNPTYQGTGTDYGYIWGAQLEAGSYATSYIPTTSASVTRNADVISKTGISSLIGQTEGTLFVDAYITGKDSSNGSILLATDKVSSGAIIRILYTQTDALRFDVFNGSSFQCQISAGAYNVGDRLKIAGAYKNNDFAMYVNGTQIGTDTSGSVPATDTANINTSIYGDTNGSFIQAAALWKTRLTNTQLAQLTAL